MPVPPHAIDDWVGGREEIISQLIMG